MEDPLADMFRTLGISFRNSDDLLNAIKFRSNLMNLESARKVLGVLTLEDIIFPPDPKKTTGNTDIDKLLLILRRAAETKESGCKRLFDLVGAPIYNALCDLVEKGFAFVALTDENVRQAQMHIALDKGNPFRGTTYNMSRTLLSPITMFPRFKTQPPAQETQENACSSSPCPAT